MKSRRVVCSSGLALLLPAILGLSCLKRNWDVCASNAPCKPGYVCTEDWRCVLPDAGTDGHAAVDGLGSTDTGGAGVDSPVSAGADGPGDSAQPDSAPTPYAQPASTDAPPAVPDTLPVVPDSPPAVPDAPPVVPDAPSPLPDGPAVDAPPSKPPVDAAGSCSTDQDCSPPSPLCLGHRCAKCADDSDCTDRPGRPACAASGLCVACTANSYCKGAAAICDTATNQCTGCVKRSDCAGTCQACSNGVCTAVKNQDDTGPGACPGTCDTTGACKSKQGQGCQAATDCAGGLFCADGTCCNRACMGSCEACDVSTTPGTCTPLGLNATPRVGHTPCLTSDATCTGRCDGMSAACSYPPSTTFCSSAFCSGNSYQAAGTCGNGACNIPDPRPCTSACVLSAGGCVTCTPGEKQCSATGVPQLCLSNGTWQNQDACAAGNTCSAGGCVCTKTTFYRDADGDGYGTVLNPTSACSAPAGYVANSGDCDDSNGSIHPGYAICNTNDRYYCDTDGTFKTATCTDGCLNGACRSDGTVGLAGWVSCGTNAVRCSTSVGCSAPYGGSGAGTCGIPANAVYAISCDGPNDCPFGQTCCYDSFQAGAVRTFCSPGTTCPPASVSDWYTPVCDPLSPQCPYPRTCQLDRGFHYCLE